LKAAIEDSLRTTTGGVFEAYSGEAGVIDEAVDEQGWLREACRAFAGAIPNLSAVELKRRHEAARRIIQEQRITYNVHGDLPGRERPWQLDPLPLLDPRSLASQKANWRLSEAGAVIERILSQWPKLSDAIAVSYFAHSTISRAGGQ